MEREKENRKNRANWLARLHETTLSSALESHVVVLGDTWWSYY